MQEAEPFRRACMAALTLVGVSWFWLSLQFYLGFPGMRRCCVCCSALFTGPSPPPLLPDQVRWARCTARCTAAPTRRCCACWRASAASTG